MAAAIRFGGYFMLKPEGREKRKTMIGACCFSLLSSIALLAVVLFNVFKGMHTFGDRSIEANCRKSLPEGSVLFAIAEMQPSSHLRSRCCSYIIELALTHFC